MASLTSLVERALRLPPPPASPDGSRGSVRVFHPAPAFLRIRLLRWFAVQLGSLFGLVFTFGWHGLPWLEAIAARVQLGPATLDDLLSSGLFKVIEVLAAAGFVAQLPFTLAAVRLDVRHRWYLVTDRSLRIREGLLKVTEQTMTFANVQNVSVSRGPLQRLLGLADLHVRSAGGGGRSSDEDSQEGSGAGLHEAVFRGIDTAAELRDFVLERVKATRGAGLGDRRRTMPAQGVQPHPLATAIARLRRSAAELRAALQDPGPHH